MHNRRLPGSLLLTRTARIRLKVAPDPPMYAKASRKPLVRICGGGAPARNARMFSSMATFSVLCSRENSTLGPWIPRNQSNCDTPRYSTPSPKPPGLSSKNRPMSSEGTSMPSGKIRRNASRAMAQRKMVRVPAGSRLRICDVKGSCPMMENCIRMNLHEARSLRTTLAPMAVVTAKISPLFNENRFSQVSGWPDRTIKQESATMVAMEGLT